MSTSAENAMASNHASNRHGNEHDTSAASAAELRQDVARTRARMSGTIDALRAKLAPPQLLASARDSVLQGAGQLATQAQALGATAQTRASDLAHTTRDHAGYQTRQVRTWFEGMRREYPWFPAALIGGACGILAGLAILGWLCTRSSD